VLVFGQSGGRGLWFVVDRNINYNPGENGFEMVVLCGKHVKLEKTSYFMIKYYKNHLCIDEILFMTYIN
jgi:hypothetical protein